MTAADYDTAVLGIPAAAVVDDDDSGATGGRSGPSQATLLVEMALERYRLLQGEDGRPYAVAKDGANIALPLRGRAGLRERLAKLYADQCGGTVPSSSALTDAVAVLEGHAHEADPEQVGLRLAATVTGVVIDLGTADGRCVVVGPDGWRVDTRSPVLFRRTALTSPLPEPVGGGHLDQLRHLLNVSDDGWQLLVGWSVAALIPDLPHPILALLGEQGTAKSTTARLLVDLIDPSPAPLRSCPRDIRQWAVTAAASWTVALDNVSTISGWLSDTLCKAVTGDGIVDRALYTDSDVSVLSFRRVIAMTSIDAGALSGDLAERLLPVELARIPADRRRTDEEVNRTFAAARPAILGALLDLLAQVLATLPTIHLDTLPRMADFARVLAAIDKINGWSSLAAYVKSTDDVAESVVDSDPFATAVRDLGDWTGTASALHELLTPDRPPQGWPKSARAVAGALRRLVPALRTSGVNVSFDRVAGGRTITVEKGETPPDKKCEGQSPASFASPIAADLHKRDDANAAAGEPAGGPDDSNDANDGQDGHPNSKSGASIGPCALCGCSTRRYGEGATGPLCQTCRAAS